MAKKQKHVYRAADGASFNNKDAAVIGIELEKIGPALTPVEVVSAASPVSSPLHKFFEWDNRKAAEKYRVFQARNIVNHLQVVVVNSSTGASENIKAYFSQEVEGEDADGEVNSERRYLHISLVTSSPVAAGNAIEDARRELVAWKSRYKQYSDHFGPVFKAIDKV